MNVKLEIILKMNNNCQFSMMNCSKIFLIFRKKLLSSKNKKDFNNSKMYTFLLETIIFQEIHNSFKKIRRRNFKAIRRKSLIKN